MESKNFSFNTGDSSSVVTVCLLPFVAAGILSFILFDKIGIEGLFLVIALMGLLAIGLKSSIKVDENQVVIQKKWFVIPYKTYKGKKIESVFYSGNYGEEEDAFSIVLKLNGQEITMGTKKDLRYLYDSLYPFTKEFERVSKE